MYKSGDFAHINQEFAAIKDSSAFRGKEENSLP